MNTAPDIIVKIKFGSHLYGTATADSDLDIKGIYIPSVRDILLQQVQPVITGGRTKQHGEKNTAADTDFEAFSLQRYLQLLAEGQTVALDILFAPSWAMLMPPHEIWHEVQKLAPRLLTKGATAFVRYCRQQANKYGIKGSRVAAARLALQFLSAAVEGAKSNARLETVTDGLVELAAQNEFLSFVDVQQANGDVSHCFDICGKKAMLNSSIRAARLITERLVNEYGQRALAAERNEGLDWKALSHACRVAHEAIELFQTGCITFPRPEAQHLLSIKQGRLPYLEVAEEIEALLQEVELSAAQSILPETSDASLIDDFVAHVYRQKVITGKRA